MAQCSSSQQRVTVQTNRTHPEITTFVAMTCRSYRTERLRHQWALTAAERSDCEVPAMRCYRT